MISYRTRGKSESCSVVSDSLQPLGLYSPWDSPGQNTGMDSLSLLQWTFPTQGTEVSCIAGGFFTNCAMREENGQRIRTGISPKRGYTDCKLAPEKMFNNISHQRNAN